MMDCNKYMIAASKATTIFMPYIDGYDFERPLDEYKLLPNAPKEAKEAFEIYKKNVSMDRQAS